MCKRCKLWVLFVFQYGRPAHDEQCNHSAIMDLLTILHLVAMTDWSSHYGLYSKLCEKKSVLDLILEKNDMENNILKKMHEYLKNRPIIKNILVPWLSLWVISVEWVGRIDWSPQPNYKHTTINNYKQQTINNYKHS